MFIVSREMGSWPFAVILTVRRAVFICGETEEMVPWTIVPTECELVKWAPGISFALKVCSRAYHSSAQS